MEPAIDVVAHRELALLEPMVGENFARLRTAVMQSRREHALAHDVFRDAIVAAGWLLASDPDSEQLAEKLPKLLDIAAVAALFVLEWQQPVPTHPDENRLTMLEYLAAFYAAVAGNVSESAQRLAERAPEDYGVATLENEPWVSAVAAGLRAAINGLEAPPELDNAYRAAGRTHLDLTQHVWLAQLECLRHIFTEDTEAFRTALDDLSAAIVQVYAGEEHEYNPHAYLALPVLGMTGLAVLTGLIANPADMN